MKKYLTILFPALLFVVLWGCKKNNDNPQPDEPETFFDFLKNTQWVGTLDINHYQYYQPCCVKINADSTIVVYAFFSFYINQAWEPHDSIKSKITAIDSLPDGRTRLKTILPYYGEQEIYFSERKTVTSIPSGPNPYQTFRGSVFNAELFTEPVSVKNTRWASGRRGGDNCPDLNSIEFLGDKPATRYYKNGKVVVYTDQITVIEAKYEQRGPMLFFYGFNETNSEMPLYFGVLTPKGDQIMVHSRSKFARLPVQWSGGSGLTPIIVRE